VATVNVRTRDKDELARFLGWFSIVLGTAELALPRALCRLVGSTGHGRAPALMRAMGVRELGHGLGILVRPRPTAWVVSRVAGDALDLALLGLVAARNPGRRARTGFAIANVTAVAVADVLESRRLVGRRNTPGPDRLVRKAVTINRPREHVEAAWADARELRAKVEARGASVSFAEAPGNRGTELVVEWTERPPAGDLGAAALKLTGKDFATELADDLRRFKQLIETGEVVRSDATPNGHLLSDHLRQRAAQPLAEVSR
jgi:uncharacterized membrane protein